MTLDLLINGTVYLFFFLFPIFFLPTTADSYEYNKMALLVVTCLILFFLLGLKNVRKRKILLVKSSFDLPLFFLAGIFLISAFFQSPNWAVSLTTPLSTTTIVAGFVLYFLLVHLKIDHLREKLLQAIVLSAFFVSVYTILLYANVLPKNTFTPAGSLYGTTIFLSIIAVYLLGRILSGFLSLGKNKSGDFSFDFITQNATTIVNTLAFIITGGAAVLLILHLFTDQKPLILPFSFGWIIFVETLKNLKTLFLGVGPANFVTAFTLAKPASFNLTPYWNIIFTSSSSFLLTIATEGGIIAVASYVIIFVKSLKFLINQTTTDNRQLITDNFAFVLALVAALTFQAVFPSSMTPFILTIILLVFVAKKQTAITIDLSRIKSFAYYLLIPQIAIILLFMYFSGRAYLGEAFFKKSLDAMVNNQGKETYDWQKKAITINPHIDRYHLAFSKTNLALANSLAGKKEPTEEDKQNIPVLIKQAIDEGRAAVSLFQTNVINWDNLASTYASIINFAQGADNFASQSFQQKIMLDPNNPNGYLSYGGFLFTLKRFEEAEGAMRRAVALKPDLANARYNLAVVLREEKKYKEAYDELKIVSSMLPVESEDAEKLNKEIEDLGKLLPPSETTPSADLKQEGSSKPQTTPIPTISLAPPTITTIKP